MWDLIGAVPDHCLSFCFRKLSETNKALSSIIMFKNNNI